MTLALVQPVLPAGADWFLRGNCRTVTNPDVMFPEKNDRVGKAAARAVCAGCPVLHDCLTHALEQREPYGVWGGLTPGQRQALGRKPRQRQPSRRSA